MDRQQNYCFYYLVLQLCLLFVTEYLSTKSSSHVPNHLYTHTHTHKLSIYLENEDKKCFVTKNSKK